MFLKFIFWISLIIILLILSFSYIQTEITTNLYKDKIALQATELCKTESNDNLKTIKILEYDNYKKTAKIYCLYNDNSKNLQIDMGYKDSSWRAVLVKRINADGSLYWPIYI